MRGAQWDERGAAIKRAAVCSGNTRCRACTHAYKAARYHHGLMVKPACLWQGLRACVHGLRWSPYDISCPGIFFRPCAPTPPCLQEASEARVEGGVELRAVALQQQEVGQQRRQAQTLAARQLGRGQRHDGRRWRLRPWRSAPCACACA